MIKKLFTTISITLLSVSVLLSNTASAKATVEDSYQHIRNATAKLHYADKTFLIDPMLAEKGAYPGFEGTVNSQLRNPLINLPMSVAEVVKGIDAIIVTHTHLDHWDNAAQTALPKNIPIIVQHQADADLITSQGFKDVRILKDSLKFGKITLHKTGGSHGTVAMYTNPKLAEALGDAMGVVLQAEQHKTLYLMGDTLWTVDVNKALNRYQPEIVVMNTGDARLEGFDGGIIMGIEDVVQASKQLPHTKIIAVHMDAVNHATVSRQQLREFIEKNQLNKQVNVPDDGETILLSTPINK